MKRTSSQLVTLSSVLAIGGIAVLGMAMSSAVAENTVEVQPERRGGAQGGPDIGAMLVQGLEKTEGCLKVITANTSVGTSTIIAWFEDKAAVKRWYYSTTHKRMMQMVGSDPDVMVPMEHVEDADAPVMVMASITPSRGESVIPGQMPVSQISIELYRPLDAGASVNGRLMPDEIELEHFKKLDENYDDQKAEMEDDS
jgi:hypothetical protein